MSSTTRQPTRAETFLSLLILTFLIIIALVILSVQNRFNPAVIHPVAQTISADASPAGVLSFPLPAGIAAMSPAEHFRPETLSDKINGRAELYLSAGFVALTTRRYRSSTDPEQWFEIFSYNMDTPANAFAVYSTQRRRDVEKSGLARYAYRTANTLVFVTGGHYVEIIAAGRGETVSSMLSALGTAYLAHNRPGNRTKAATLDPQDLFPAEGRIPDSLALIAKDAFGFDRLDQVYTTRYRDAGTETGLFVSLRSSPEAAQALAGAYREFLIRFGGVEETPPEFISIKGLVVINVMDAYELIFSRGPYLAGVHMADDLDRAGQLAVKLDRKLTNMGAAP